MKNLRWLAGMAFLAILPVPLRADPVITLSSVPEIGSTANLAGQVLDAEPSTHRVAVYIFVEGWWNKPSFGAPLTAVQPDGSWTCDITTGPADPLATRIAAFLVPQSYTPPQLSGAPILPAGLETNSLASVTADRHAPSAFHWCGYDWDVKSSGTSTTFGPGPNYFSDRSENVWVDGSGKLHLRITKRDGQWQCAEVISRRSFGYGTYRFFLDSAVDALDPNVVLGLFTYDHDPTATGGHREIDVEMARWGDAGDLTNAQYVVQPAGVLPNKERWTLPAGAAPTTHSFTWSAGRVDFVSHQGSFAPHTASIPPITVWSRTGGYVPVPGNETVRMNLWLNHGTPPTDGQEVEVVIDRFAFIPPQLEAPKIESSARDTGGLFHLDLRGEPQLWYQTESSPDLLRWTPQAPFIAPEAAFQTKAPTAGPRGFLRVAVVPGQ